MSEAHKEEQRQQVERHNQELEQYLRQLDFESMSAEDMLRWAASFAAKPRIMTPCAMTVPGLCNFWGFRDYALATES